MASNFFYGMVDEFQGAKMKFFSDDYHEHLYKIIGPENLQEKYGGELPNNSDNFWPPKFNLHYERRDNTTMTEL